MFIKKDTRKIPDILSDESDEREELHLGRRYLVWSYETLPTMDGSRVKNAQQQRAERGSSEFVANGIKVVCSSRNSPRLQKLQKLSLYDNMLTNVKSIGALSATPLKHLNLGRNQLKSLPLELGKVETLETLWADDNAIPDFPRSVLRLKRLEELRLSGNRISEVPADIAALSELRVLALDNNDLKAVPAAIGALPHLRSLLLRQNELEELPAEVGDLVELRTLGVSSNRLESLPSALGRLVLLEFLFANGNRLRAVPPELAALPHLKKANLANNSIHSLPIDVEAAWGRPDAATGKLDPLTVGSPRTVEVLIRGNPIAEAKAEDSDAPVAAGDSVGSGNDGAMMDEAQ